MSFKKAVKISLVGIAVETMGVILDIGHHLNIGIESPEGLITPFHLLVFIGFIVSFIGIVITATLRKF